MRPSVAQLNVELAAMSKAVRGRLDQRFPTIPADQIDACLYGAAIGLAHARVRNFLPILIERRAAEALSGRPTTGSASSADGPGHLIDDAGRSLGGASLAFVSQDGSDSSGAEFETPHDNGNRLCPLGNPEDHCSGMMTPAMT